jgi:hypothetical protein
VNRSFAAGSMTFAVGNRGPTKAAQLEIEVAAAMSIKGCRACNNAFLLRKCCGSRHPLTGKHAVEPGAAAPQRATQL